jgi:hypothetical protein
LQESAVTANYSKECEMPLKVNSGGAVVEICRKRWLEKHENRLANFIKQVQVSLLFDIRLSSSVQKCFAFEFARKIATTEKSLNRF